MIPSPKALPEAPPSSLLGWLGRGWDRWAPKTPKKAFLASAVFVVVLELGIMLALAKKSSATDWLDAYLDTGTLLVMMPFLYVLFIRPLARAIEDRTRQGEQLQRTCEELEVQVRSRTLQLEYTTHALRSVEEEHTRKDARLKLQGRLLDTVQQGVVATGKGGGILYWNRFAERLFGWTEAEAWGKTLSLVTPFPEAALKEGVLGGTQGWRGEVQALRRDGTRFPAYLTSAPLAREDASLAGVVCTFIDITERKAAEEAIRMSEEKYQSLVEGSPTGIFTFREGRVVFANPRFFQIVGRAPGDLQAVDPRAGVHPQDWPGVQATWARALAGEAGVPVYECRIVRPDGQVRWVIGRITATSDREGRALLVNIQDITERYHAEQELRDSREVLHRLSARLLSVQESERQRIARELHDSIGQSLSAIKFMVERGVADQYPEERRATSGSLQAVVPAIQKSIEEVRRISMALRPSTLDDLGLVATLSWFVREFRATYPHIRVEKAVEVDETRMSDTLKVNLFRIVQEALHNAAKHSGADRITVDLRQRGGEWHLDIEDDGLGFDPSPPRVPGEEGGYGLTTMRERTELFGGTLTLASAPGEGTRVHACWPLEAPLPTPPERPGGPSGR